MRYDSPNTITADLVASLEWATNQQYSTVCKEQRTNVLLFALNKCLAESTRAESRFRCLIDRCNEASFDRFLNAPSLWQVVTTRDANTLPLLERMIDDEIRVIDAIEYSVAHASVPVLEMDSLPPNCIWDACGLHAVDANVQPGRVLYQNATISGTLFADAASIWVRDALPDIPTKSDPYNASDYRKSVSKLSDAAALLARFVPGAWTFVEQLTRVVVLKCDADVIKGGFVSASTPLCTGRPVLQNPHADFVNVEMLADALLHESIHSAFDAAEYFDTKLPERDTAHRLASPWTGKQLDPNTYIQASYVWFGLFNFWASALSQSPETWPRAQKLFQKTARGFRDSTFLSRARARADLYDQETLGALEFIAHSASRTLQGLGQGLLVSQAS